MGIQGLLPFVKKASREVDIKSFSGATVAVDTYCWLHKGAFSCAEKLVKGETTDGYVHYCMKMVNMLLAAGVKPILVFDGCNLPLKKNTEEKRRQNRENTRKKGKELLREGKLKEARECFQRCIDVTSEMAHNVIQACRKKNVDCIVAPYEADAQLAYLNKCGIAHIIISEDSDLILFGCEKIIFKMDTGGRGIMVESMDLNKCLGSRAEKFTFDKFRYMCILSGCDYLPSLPGIGLAKACKFFSLVTNLDLNVVLSKLPSYLKMPNLTVTSEYKEAFVKANNTFLYQLVYCPLKKKLVPLNPYPANINPKELSYAGPYLPNDVASQIALGNINVQTMKPIDDYCPVAQPTKSISWEAKENSPVWSSIWEENYKVHQLVSYQELSKETVKDKGVGIKLKNNFKPNSYGKRLHSPPAVVDVMPNNEDLYAMYSSSSQKKLKLEQLSPDHQKSTKTPQSTCKPSVLNQFKVATTTSTSPVVKSRFFFHPNTENLKKECTSKTTSWLDKIDKEYLVDCNATCSNEVSQPVATDKYKSNSQGTENEPCEESINQYQNMKKLVSHIPREEITCSKEENIGFYWKNIGSMSTCFSDAKLSSSPDSNSAFKQVYKLPKLIDNINDVSSQSKNLSQDNDISLSATYNDYSINDSLSQKSDSSLINHHNTDTPDSGIEISPTPSEYTCSTEPDDEPSILGNFIPIPKQPPWCTPPSTCDAISDKNDVLDDKSSAPSSPRIISTVDDKHHRIAKKRHVNKSLKLGLLKRHHSENTFMKTLKQTSLMESLQKFQYKRKT